MKGAGVSYYPVVHLMTGPPGLFRNGGIWKRIKQGLRSVQRPSRFMVQAMHFALYDISPRAWHEWMTADDGLPRLRREIISAFGKSPDVFVDSGGFQLLYRDKIDLSRWNLEVSCEDIMDLQAAFGPTKIASLDSPLPPLSGKSVVAKLTSQSIRNAAWLAESVDSLDPRPTPYLAVHGRSPREIEAYLNQLREALPRGWLRGASYGLALGSQVPLSADPELIINNVLFTLGWMDHACAADVPLHIFGVGEGLIGEVRSRNAGTRAISFDNSTYAQNAFRLRVYDPSRARYVPFAPYARPACGCNACSKLKSYGSRVVSETLTQPAYRSIAYGEEKLSRSDIMALIALHNMRWWTERLRVPPHRLLRTGSIAGKPITRDRGSLSYRFPLEAFTPRAPCLVLTQCSRVRPYRESPTQRRMIAHLASNGLKEGSDYDRVTLSGLHGPVHWAHEETPSIMGYDFSLGATTSPRHVTTLRMTTALVLGVIGKKYSSGMAYLPNRHYRRVFGPVVESFGIPILASIGDLAPHRQASGGQV